VSLAGIRAAIGGQPWALQFVEAMLLTDFVQYWFHRAFHRVPLLWGFHAVHHSAKAMDWLAGARMHFVEIILLRSVTSLPLLTFGFLPSVMQAYVALVYIYSGLVHANLKGDFDRFGHFMVTPRFHHWHHGLEAEAVDVNFAIHFPLWDKLFGTFHLPAGRWPQGYGIPEKMPNGNSLIRSCAARKRSTRRRRNRRCRIAFMRQASRACTSITSPRPSGRAEREPKSTRSYAG
jgi:sterol desaturase/sphingolipid hydroxylase (fatty acid hydroxylase superfamily)